MEAAKPSDWAITSDDYGEHGIKVLGKDVVTVSDDDRDDGARVLRVEVRDYKGNIHAEDGIYVYITEDEYDGMNLQVKLEDFANIVNKIKGYTG